MYIVHRSNYQRCQNGQLQTFCSFDYSKATDTLRKVNIDFDQYRRSYFDKNRRSPGPNVDHLLIVALTIDQ